MSCIGAAAHIVSTRIHEDELHRVPPTKCFVGSTDTGGELKTQQSKPTSFGEPKTVAYIHQVYHIIEKKTRKKKIPGARTRTRV